MKSQLSLSASQLCDYQLLSTPWTKRSIAIVYAKIKKDGYRDELEEIGRTEVIMNNSYPIWIQKINLAFHFESVQPLV
ncbi:putative protein BONZAI [Helianthus anomalus]